MYIFFLDIDGTVYSNNEVSPKVVEAIDRARQKGHKVIINTARAYIGIPRQIYDIPLDGYISSLGLEVFLDGRFIHRKYMPCEQIRKIAKYALEHGLGLFFEGDKRMNLNWVSPGDIHASDMSEVEAAISEFGFCKAVLDSKMSEEHKIILSEGYQRVSNELIALGYDKTSGMKMVGDFYGVPRENMVAIGDTDPDITMLSYAGIGVCMGNGSSNLKAISKYITLSVHEDGVAHAIDCILNKNLDALKIQK
ncbi:MAG: HAD family hydrolase [Clostridia bacterium]|nr:HAD family hydrolase [Clostridia bacterium]